MTIVATPELSTLEMAQIPMVRDFVDVFFDMEPGLPPISER